MNSDQAMHRFATARVGRLATITPDGHPHLVPIVFAVRDATIYTAVDAKPKSTTGLARLKNIGANPGVSVLVDFYDEDWSLLWWVRADGRAHLAHPSQPDETETAIALLTARYPQYETAPPPGPVIAIQVDRWTGWSAL